MEREATLYLPSSSQIAINRYRADRKGKSKQYQYLLSNHLVKQKMFLLNDDIEITDSKNNSEQF